MNTPFSTLADFVAFLQANAALIGAANTIANGDTLTVTGGATSGRAIVATGGTPNGQAITATGAGSASAVLGTGGATGSGGNFVGGAGAGSFTVPAIKSQGYIDLSLATNPASTQVVANNALGPKNICKAWACMQIAAAGVINVLDGYNIASASWNVSLLTVNLATAMANINYAPVAMSDFWNAGSVTCISATAFTTSTFIIQSTTPAGAAQAWNPAGGSARVYVQVYGTQ